MIWITAWLSTAVVKEFIQQTKYHPLDLEKKSLFSLESF